MSTDSAGYNPESPHYNSPPVTIVLTVILLVLFFVGFFSIYFCRCFLENVVDTWHFRRTPSGNLLPSANQSNNPGLDPSLIQYFPTFAYSDVKHLGRRRCGLECAICLAEFGDDDLLRLLTVCYHVFHQECIDLWLQSHKTCPVCRGNLDLPQEELVKSPVILHDSTNNNFFIGGSEHGSKMSNDDSISILIKDDNSEGTGGEPSSDRHRGSNDKTVQQNENRETVERFSRSHSTGHSIAMSTGEDDKYTLRLPQYVKIKITKGHNWTKSCITFGEYSNTSPKATATDFGEASG